MSEKIENKNIEEIEGVVEETASEGILSKAGKFMKRNAKKIVAGATIVGAIGVAYVLGKNSVGAVSEAVDAIADAGEDVVDAIADEVTEF